MVGIFAVSITPRQLLHDIVTNHTHSPIDAKGDSDVLSKGHFVCDTDNLIATSPFVEGAFALLIADLHYFFTYPDSIQQGIYSSDQVFTHLRGPPAIALL